MLDIAKIREDPAGVAELLSRRADGIDLDSILAMDTERRAAITGLDQLNADRKARSKAIHEAAKRNEDTTGPKQEAADLGARISDEQARLAELESRLEAALLELPNLPDPDIPVGGKESNQVVSTTGAVPEFDFEPLDHVELCTKLGLVDYERGVKLAGSGSWVYTGLGAALEWALLDYFCRSHFQAGYTFMLPPHMLLRDAGTASGQFPKFEDAVYHIDNPGGDSERFLLPTSETAILSVYRDEILTPEQLPMKVFAYTPCYRRESGSYRSEERGTIRGHQFNKVEMFQFIQPEDADAALAELLGRTEQLMVDLGLHFQTSLLGTLDASASMRKTLDVEVFLPSLGIYKEVSSVSWAGDYQARRANIRYRGADGRVAGHVHTLNGSGLATSRLLPAIVEQNQQADGSVVVPEVLRPWTGVEVISPS